MKDIADIKDTQTFLQAIDGMEREDLRSIKRSLELKLTDINVTIAARQLDNSPVETPLANAKFYTIQKLSHIDRKLKAFNDRDKEKASQTYWMIYRGPEVGWVYSKSGPKEWLEHDCRDDPHAPLCEAVRITQQEYENRKTDLPYLEPK